MIVFYTRYNVIDSFNTEALLKFAFECVNGMRNVPDEFKHHSWNSNDESGEWKSGRNLMAYEMDLTEGIVAFRVAIVDQNDELWTTDIVLNEKIHEIQLRLAREKKIISVEFDRGFNIPYMFKKLIRDGVGGMDYDLPITDSPVYIDETNIGIIVDIINQNKKHNLPVIYVSHPFVSEDYEINVVELAKDMAGSAHVLVERDSSISTELKDLTGGKNAYNGAIDIFYNDDSFRYLRWSELTANQYRYKISHAVYSRMAMRNIDETVSLSAIRLKNKTKKLKASDLETQKLALRIDELEEKYKESQELVDYTLEETKTHEKRVNDLENENYDLHIKVDALTESLNRKQGEESGKTIAFEYSEKQFYEDEIKRIILECIRASISTYGDDEQKRRDYHILSDIIQHNAYSEAGNNIKQEMLRIIKKNRLSKSDVSSLRGLGFELQQGSHDKYVFHGDDRYIITVSNSPSDYRSGENLAHEAINLIFGRTS